MMNISFDKYVIQSLNTTDHEAFYNLVNDNRPRLINFFPGTSARTTSIEETQEYMMEISENMQSKTYLPYIIIDKTTDRYIGLVDFKNMDWRVPKTEMGYLIDKDYEGFGIITRAAKLVIQYVIDQYDFKKILCRISPENPSSINVVKRLGFELEGKIRNDFVSPTGGTIDLHYYGKVF